MLSDTDMHEVISISATVFNLVAHHWYMQGLWEVGTSVRVPENQEGVCASLKGSIALAIDVLILSFFFSLSLFFLGGQLFFVDLEK